MWMVPYTFRGTTYYLLLNAEAYFSICETCGSKGFITDHIRGGGKEALENTCFFLAKLAEQGELYRRYMGYDKGRIPTKKLFLRRISLVEILRAKIAVFQAIAAGLPRETAPKQKEIDVGLLELQRNSESALTRSGYLNYAMRFLGMDFQEAMLLPVGLVFDLLELEFQRRGLRRKGG